MDSGEACVSPPSTFNLFPDSPVQEIPESSMDTVEVLDSSFIPASSGRFDALQVLGDIEWPSLPARVGDSSDSDI